MIDQQVTRRERGAVDRLVSSHLGYQLVGSVFVREAEGAASERRETDAKHCADISLHLSQVTQSESHRSVRS